MTDKECRPFGRQTNGAPLDLTSAARAFAPRYLSFMAQSRNAAPATAPATNNTPATTPAPTIATGAMPGWAVKLPDGTNLLLVLDMDAEGNVSNLFAIIPNLPFVATGTAFNQ